jgi:hypothetical protein
LGKFSVQYRDSFLIVRGVYAPTKRDKNYVLTFLTFNTLAFLIAGLLSEIDLSVGFGLGLFAIFSILRFRTDPIPVREMAYLFVMLALPVINAVLLQEEIYDSLIIANLAVVAVLLLAERAWGLRSVSQKTITYEHIEWVKPDTTRPCWPTCARARAWISFTARSAKLTSCTTWPRSRSRTTSRRMTWW